jgi:hypothetical protein
MTTLVTHTRLESGVTVFKAWERSYLIDGFPAHGTLRKQDGVWYGAVVSRFAPASIDNMPDGPERAIAETAWQVANETEAVAAILKCHPRLLEIGGVVRNGDVEVSTDEETHP